MIYVIFPFKEKKYPSILDLKLEQNASIYIFFSI